MRDDVDLEWFKVTNMDTIHSTLVNISDSSVCVQVVLPLNSESKEECVSESLSSLLTARALMKNKTSTSEAWKILSGIMQSQGPNGFIPKYSYYTNTNITINGYNNNHSPASSSSPWYLPSDLFSNNEGIPSIYFPKPKQTYGGYKLKTSGRISAVPFHSSFALDTFLLSPQMNEDVKKLELLFQQLWNWHEFIHSILLPTNCPSSSTANFLPSCFNVIHPWETIFPFHPQFIDLQYWTQILQPQYVPNDIKIADFETINKGFDDLLKCQQGPHSQVSSTLTTIDDNYKNSKDINNDDVNSVPFSPLDLRSNDIKTIDQTVIQMSRLYEQNLVDKCKFSMMDVTYAAALAQSDRDLQQILTILEAKMVSSTLSTFYQKNVTLSKWIAESTKIYQKTFSNKNHTYLSSKKKEKHTNITNTTTAIIDQPVAFNFMGAWVLDRTKTTDERNKVMSFLMLEKEGNFSFNCEEFPLQLRGNCAQLMSQKQDKEQILSPSLNFLLMNGMKRNNFLAISSDLSISTIHSICRLPQNSLDYNLERYCNEAYDQSQQHSHFPLFPPFLSSRPYIMNPNNAANTISVTSSATAATVYNLLVPDPPFFTYTANPPIRSAVVLVIIILELIVAFGIGVSCLVLNLNLMRRLRREDDNDAFVRRLHDRRTLLSQLYGQTREIIEEEEIRSFHDDDEEHSSLNTTDNDRAPTDVNVSRSRLASTFSSVQDYVASFSLFQKFSSNNSNEKPPSPAVPDGSS